MSPATSDFFSGSLDTMIAATAGKCFFASARGAAKARACDSSQNLRTSAKLECCSRFLAMGGIGKIHLSPMNARAPMCAKPRVNQGLA